LQHLGLNEETVEKAQFGCEAIDFLAENDVDYGSFLSNEYDFD
jgi:hypothetical protein